MNQINESIVLKNLQEENQRLKVLLHLAENLQTHLDLDKLLLTTMEEVAKILKADRCTVFLLDEDKNELWSIVAMGIEKGKEIRFPADRGIAGHVARTGEILNIPDAYKDSRFNPDIDKKTGYKTKNMLTMPLKNRDGITIGVYQILNKFDGPFTRADEELLSAISQITATTVENSLLYEEQVESLNSFVDTLSATLDTRDYITAGHSRRVTLYSVAICKQLKAMDCSCEEVRFAGLLHDIGKLGIPEDVLFKAGKLNQEEYQLIKKHPAVTRQILESIHFPRNLKNVPEIASTHHEKLNGQGYPDGLKNGEIPPGGRMLALADVFDALTSRRQYRDREPIEKVWETIEKEAGDTFDIQLMKVFLEVPLKQIIEILEYDQRDRLNEKELTLLAEIPLGTIIEIKRKDPESLDDQDKNINSLFDKYYQRNY
ncbi:MAG: GAF domain-containing protein [Calditrichaeota bacterium]|nr:GAF domain-containing protein [Calditrichota bacterium]